MSFESGLTRSEVMCWNSGQLADYLKKVSSSYFSFDKRARCIQLNEKYIESSCEHYKATPMLTDIIEVFIIMWLVADYESSLGG